MNKILAIIIFTCYTVIAAAQTHYKESINVELGAGINDMSCVSPVVAVGYTFNRYIAGYARYSFAIGNETGYSFMENNIELYAAFTPMDINEKVFFNINAGAIIKLQDFKGFVPTPRTGNINLGAVLDAELEWSTGVYWSIVGRMSYRALFLDENIRQELFYSAGVRMSLNIFNAAERRLLHHRKRL